MGAPEVEAFLSHLAVDRGISASTQNQALAALLFLYREVLGVELPWLDGVTRAKPPERVPVVMTRAEIDRLFAMTSARFASFSHYCRRSTSREQPWIGCGVTRNLMKGGRG
jgi:site-specific recombinase XerD